MKTQAAHTSTQTPHISVIIAHSPGRRAQLELCLAHLQKQRLQAQEILICDDGSEDTAWLQSVPANPHTPIQHLWRPNDRKLSRSRNLGAQAAQGEILVFLNSDVLLNPEALQAYAQVLQQQASLTLWGYIGCRKAVTAPSQWHPEKRVNWLDFRFFPLSDTRIWVLPDFEQRPHHYASGHHFALHRNSYNKIGPLNENFVEWGDEDVEFALRSLLKGHPMCLLGDAWGEHLAHPYQERFHLQAQSQKAHKSAIIQALEEQLQPEQLQAGVLFGPQLPVLHAAIQQYYLPHHPSALQTEMQRLRF